MIRRIEKHLSYIAFSVLLVQASALAQELPINLSKVCNIQTAPNYKEFWPAITKASPIPVPQTVLLPTATDPTNAKCDLAAVAASGSPGFANFNEAAKMCGYRSAVSMSLIFGVDNFCPHKDAKQPQCKSIREIWTHLDDKILNPTSAGASTPPAGTYTFILGSQYVGASTYEKMQFLLDEAGHWSANGSPKANGTQLVCGAVRAEPFKIPVPSTKIFAISKDPPSVTRRVRGEDRDLSKFNAAELSLAYDRENRTVTERDANGEPIASEYDDFVTFKGAIGYNINRDAILDRKAKGARTFWNDSILVAYSALEYAEAFDATEETDNLAFGVRGLAQLGWNDSQFIGNPTLDLAWVTDIEERESALWRASGSAGLLWFDRQQWMEDWIPIKWTTDGVIDYLHVIDEGDKTSLSGIGEAIRLGYDIEWELDRTFFEIGDYRPSLSGTYKYRDSTDESGPDADLVTVDLGLIPLKKSEAGIGLAIGYERGENLTSLEPVEAYKIKLQIKN